MNKGTGPRPPVRPGYAWCVARGAGRSGKCWSLRCCPQASTPALAPRCTRCLAPSTAPSAPKPRCARLPALLPRLVGVPRSRPRPLAPCCCPGNARTVNSRRPCTHCRDAAPGRRGPKPATGARRTAAKTSASLSLPSASCQVCVHGRSTPRCAGCVSPPSPHRPPVPRRRHRAREGQAPQARRSQVPQQALGCTDDFCRRLARSGQCVGARCVVARGSRQAPHNQCCRQVPRPPPLNVPRAMHVPRCLHGGQRVPSRVGARPALGQCSGKTLPLLLATALHTLPTRANCLHARHHAITMQVPIRRSKRKAAAASTEKMRATVLEENAEGAAEGLAAETQGVGKSSGAQPAAALPAPHRGHDSRGTQPAAQAPATRSEHAAWPVQRAPAPGNAGTSSAAPNSSCAPGQVHPPGQTAVQPGWQQPAQPYAPMQSMYQAHAPLLYQHGGPNQLPSAASSGFTTPRAGSAWDNSPLAQSPQTGTNPGMGRPWPALGAPTHSVPRLGPCAAPPHPPLTTYKPYLPHAWGVVGATLQPHAHTPPAPATLGGRVRRRSCPDDTAQVHPGAAFGAAYWSADGVSAPPPQRARGLQSAEPPAHHTHLATQPGTAAPLISSWSQAVSRPMAGLSPSASAGGAQEPACSALGGSRAGAQEVTPRAPSAAPYQATMV